MRSRRLRIGYLPFYVNYFENVSADFAHEKPLEAKSCASDLAKYGDVVWDGTLIGDVDTADKQGRRLATQDVDCIVVVTTIAVFGSIPWAAVKHLNVPILAWNAQQIETVGPGYTMVDIVRNTGQIGVQAFANTLLREARAFRIITGYQKSELSSEELERYFRIIGAAASVRRAKLLAIGDQFTAMTDIQIDDAILSKHIGARIVRASKETLTERYVGIPQPQVDAHVENLVTGYRTEGMTPDTLDRSARLCEAVQSLADEHDADAGTVNCHMATCMRNPEIGITACYSLGIQNALGRPFTCTGDLPTAIAMLLLKRLTGCSMYTEVQVLDEHRKAIVIANSGEGEDPIRREGASPAVLGCTNFAGTHGRGASFAYPLKSGPATIVNFTPTPKGIKPYRLIVTEGHILDDPLPDAGALAGFFQFRHLEVHVGYRRWLEAGPVHHSGTTLGHWASDLQEVAEILDIEFVEI